MMPLVDAGLLAAVPAPMETLRSETLRSTPHPFPFGARSMACRIVCAFRPVTYPTITRRVRSAFRIHSPDRNALLGGSKKLSCLYVGSGGTTNYAGAG